MAFTVLRHRLGILSLLAFLVSTACTGAPRPDSVAAGDRQGTSTTSTPETVASPATDDDTGTSAAAPSASDPTSSGSTETPAPASESTPTDPQPSSGPADDGPFMADLYSAGDDRVGITDDRIRLCGHAALIFADAFDTNREDLNVYWEWVNDNGGIYGREVTLDWKDDSYSPDTARQRIEECWEQDPFFILGGIGFDQIPAARDRAEELGAFYVHHVAMADPDGLQYSFTSLPSVEELGRAFGEFITAEHGSKKIGIIARSSENWEPGHRTGKTYMEEHGVDIAADRSVNANQTLFTQEILDMRDRGVEVVWIWDNALAAAEFIQQSHAQNFHPTFVVAPFQTTLDVVGEDALISPIQGVWTSSAYTIGGYRGKYAYTDHGYQQEIDQFEAVMEEYRPDTTLNDILWQTWIGNKALHEMLLDCGEACSRNRLAGMMIDGYQKVVEPNCAADYSRPSIHGFTGHQGGWAFFVQEAFDKGGGEPGFRTTSWCREHFHQG